MSGPVTLVFQKPGLPACIILLSLFLHGATAQEAEPQPPMATVGIVTLHSASRPLVHQLPGRVVAIRTAEVRARVTGILQQRVFQQGSFVKKGDILFRIEPELFEVRVASAGAALQKAIAVRENAKRQLERQMKLRQSDAVSEATYDAAVATLAEAEADVGLQQAAVDEARINLGHTEVRAPISGIIGGALVTEGALVTAEGTAALATIQQIDSVYVDFTQSAEERIALKRAIVSGSPDQDSSQTSNLELLFGDGEVYSRPGRLLFSNVRVDPDTGKVTLRAEFPNPDGNLLPGMFVRVRLSSAMQRQAFLLPQRAVQRNSEGNPQVFVVSQDGVARLRDVTLGEATGSDWVVISGLVDGERVVVEGGEKIGSGTQVETEPWQRETLPFHSEASHE